MNRQAGLDIPPPRLTVTGDDGVRLDLEALLSSRLLLQGSSRSGKTHLARCIIEEAAPLIQVIVIDWEGELHTLNQAYPFVHLGDVADGADLSLTANSARHLCREMVGSGASVIVDLSEMEVEARYEVAALFLDELMHLPKARRRPRLVVVDEGHELAPQGGDVPSSKAVRAIASRGGKRGLGLFVIVQRVAKLDKSVCEAMNWIVARTVLDVDVRRAAEQFGMTRHESQALKTLPWGTYFAFGPAIGDGSVQLVRTGDPKSHHARGMALTPPPGASEIAAALAEFRERGDTPDEDAGRQELLETIERLRRELASAKEGNTSDPADIRRAVTAATTPLEAKLRALQLQRAAMLAHATLILTTAGEIPPETDDRNEDLQIDVPAGPEPEPSVESGQQGASCGPTGEHDNGVDPGVEGDLGPESHGVRGDYQSVELLGLTEIQRRMVAVLQECGTLIHEHLAAKTGQSSTSSTFRAHRKAIVDAGLAHYPQPGFTAPGPAPEEGS